VKKGNMKIMYAKDATPVGSRPKDDGYYPSITLGKGAVESMKDLDVGDEVVLTMRGVVQSKSENETDGMSMQIECQHCEKREENDEESDIDDEMASRALKLTKKKMAS